MGAPLVSIILCTNNGMAYLQEQLESLAKQDYPSLEIICADNGSTDGAAAALQQWASQLPGRKFISYKEKGLNKNFFNAMKFTSGEYIMFSDQDDIWLPGKVSRLVAFQEGHVNASMVYCLSKPFTDRLPALENTSGIHRLEGNDIRQTLLISFTLGHNILIRKSILDKIPVPVNEIVAYDWWITVSAMRLGNIYCLQQELTYWRQHPGNTTKILNSDLFYKSRQAYLRQFATNTLLTINDKQWISEAGAGFAALERKKFSFTLFRFLLKYAGVIFFYKKKNTIVSKYISFIKWSFRMSHRSYRP